MNSPQGKFGQEGPWGVRKSPPVSPIFNPAIMGRDPIATPTPYGQRDPVATPTPYGQTDPLPSPVVFGQRDPIPTSAGGQRDPLPSPAGTVGLPAQRFQGPPVPGGYKQGQPGQQRDPVATSTRQPITPMRIGAPVTPYDTTTYGPFARR